MQPAAECERWLLSFWNESISILKNSQSPIHDQKPFSKICSRNLFLMEIGSDRHRDTEREANEEEIVSHLKIWPGRARTIFLFILCVMKGLTTEYNALKYQGVLTNTCNTETKLPFNKIDPSIPSAYEEESHLTRERIQHSSSSWRRRRRIQDIARSSDNKFFLSLVGYCH
jgi:hypothetical protein